MNYKSKMANTECGISCLVSKIPISYHSVIGMLKSLQHRGRDSFGVSCVSDGNIVVEKHQGHVKNPNLSKLSNSWVGHVRYSTSTKMMKYCQPIYCDKNKFSIVHNGNIRSEIWTHLRNQYNLVYDRYDSDTYKLKILINHYITQFSEPFEKILERVMESIKGSFCVLLQTNEKIYILRDRYGFKPLSYKIDQDRICITSETVCDTFSYFERGSVYTIDVSSMEMKKVSQYDISETPSKKCVFENIYFMRENTYFDDISVRKWRQEIGKKLFLETKDEFQKENTIVCGVPSSGIVYGESFSFHSGIEYSQFLKKKSDYPHRTFILSTNEERKNACKRKYFVDCDIENKKVILLDDSVVRGNTMKYLVSFVKEYKPKEIHLLVACPKITNPCFYGVDFPDIEELVANKMTETEMRDYFGLDSITFLDLENLKESDSYCSACFDGNYVL